MRKESTKVTGCCTPSSPAITHVVRFGLYIFVAFLLPCLNGCGPSFPSFAEAKQNFEKAQVMDTYKAYCEFLTSIYIDPADLYDSHLEYNPQYGEFREKAKNRIREKFLEKGNRIELRPVMTPYILFLGSEGECLDECWRGEYVGYDHSCSCFEPWDDSIKTRIERELVARGYSVVWGDTVYCWEGWNWNNSGMVKWWNNSGTVKRDRNIFSSRPVIWQSVKCLGGPQEMMSRRDAGFDVVIAVGVNLRRPKSADDPSQLGTKATMPRVIMSGGAKFDAIDTSDGTVILQGEYSADRTKQRIGERPVYHGYETLYRMTESEDSFLTRLISGLLASVPEYHPQKTTSPLK